MPVGLRALLPVPVAVARLFCLVDASAAAFDPREELVAGDPVVVLPVLVVLRGVPPAAIIAAEVLLIVGMRALLPDPVAEAVFITSLNWFNLAIVPRLKLVAADPVVVIPVFVFLWGVPPSAFFFAEVVLPIHSGALLPVPGAEAFIIVY